MLKKSLLAMSAAATALTVATPAMADNDRKRYRNSGYEQVSSRDVWRGRDGRYYCRRSNGTTGLVIGAASGALLGREIDTRGSRATGTILGAAAGALIGREVQKSLRCR